MNAQQPAQLDQSGLQKIVLAGQRVMYDPKTVQYFIDGLKKDGDPTTNLAEEVVGILKMLDDKSGGKLPRQILAPAAIALLVEAAHFAAQAGFFIMSKEQIALAGKKAIVLVIKHFGTGNAITNDGAPQQPAQPPAQGLINNAIGGV